MFNLFHCVPGGASKFPAFGTYTQLLADGGVLAGCTILEEKYASRWVSKWMLKKMNHMGILNNLEDNEGNARRALENQFEGVETWLVGMVLLSSACKPRQEILQVF
ncbi:hypothetical protein F4819DRAFT_472395, partial [Hypoxylon fuscum]